MGVPILISLETASYTKLLYSSELFFTRASLGVSKRGEVRGGKEVGVPILLSLETASDTKLLHSSAFFFTRASWGATRRWGQ